MEHWDIGTLLHDDGIPDNTELRRFQKTLNKPVIIYGAGYRGKLIASLCREFQLPIAAVCDKNLAGKTIQGLGRVCSFEEAIRSLTDYQVVIASVPYKNEIEQYVKSIVPDCDTRSFDFPYMIEVGNTGPMEYRRFVRENIAALEALSRKLSDEMSRKTLYSIIKARLTWDYGYLKEVYVPGQYFVLDVVPLHDDEVFYDCGAWIGDSLAELAARTQGQFRKAVCFEPGTDAGQKLRDSFAEEIREGKVELISSAVSQQAEVQYFRPQTSGSQLLEAEGAGADSVQMQTTSIDLTAQDRMAPTYIKMDIEGAELAALKGAEKTIRTYRPKLAVCVYHKVADLVEIPQYIDSLHLNYRYFLRHHSGNLCESVLYAIPEQV